MKILVTGSAGMIGINLVRILLEREKDETTIKVADLKYREYGNDLRDPRQAQDQVCGCNRVFHLADHTAGLGYAQHHHGEMMTNSLLISLNLLEAARKAGVTDYLYVSSSCVYADHYMNEAVPEFYADSYMPEQANEGYGWAKRIAEKQCRYFYLEHGMRTIIVRPANIYGPSYDWSRPVEDMHVIPALITKMLRGDPEIVVWGSGKQLRTFQYETDTARIMVELMAKGAAGEAYNLGGFEICIGAVARTVGSLIGWKGKLRFDLSKPEGPQRKAHDTSKLKEIVTIQDNSFVEGLGLTIAGARRALQLSRS